MKIDAQARDQHEVPVIPHLTDDDEDEMTRYESPEPQDLRKVEKVNTKELDTAPIRDLEKVLYFVKYLMKLSSMFAIVENTVPLRMCQISFFELCDFLDILLYTIWNYF